MKIGIVVPHIFMHPDILPHVIFSPGRLAIDLATSLQKAGTEVTLFTPGVVTDVAPTITADMSYFEQELAGRGDTYIDLLKKHAFTFVTLARQVQSELIATAFAMANRDELDVVHIYCNEEDIALPFAKLCKKPVVFTHHDPFNFLIKYKNVFPKYKDLNWLSMSYAQRKGMPDDTNWVGNIYHGIDEHIFKPNYGPNGDYIAYLGRIIEPKGVHLAIAAVQKYNQQNPDKTLKLKIAGKHYSDSEKDHYWHEKILPYIDGDVIEYAGFLSTTTQKQDFLGNARALIIPSTFEEPFGMVMIEALACATPLIGLNSGAIPEVIQNDKNGVVVPKIMQLSESGAQLLDEERTAQALSDQFDRVIAISRTTSRTIFEEYFSLARMTLKHRSVYETLARPPKK